MTRARNQDGPAMLRAYVHEDRTLNDIGRQHGVTRERVRQLLEREDPTLYRLALQRRKARTRLRNLPLQPSPGVCATCGASFTKAHGNRAYCSNAHLAIADLLRYHTNPTRQASHRRIVARRLREVSNDPAKLRYANRVLDGSAEQHGRWFLTDSVTYAAALEAYQKGWPIFERLHPQLQAQLRAGTP